MDCVLLGFRPEGQDDAWACLSTSKGSFTLGMSLEAVEHVFGPKKSVFPPVSDLPFAGMWDEAIVWFDGGGRCCSARLVGKSNASIEGFALFGQSYHATVDCLRAQYSDLVLARDRASLVDHGVILHAPSARRDKNPACAVDLVAEGSQAIAVERVRRIARAMLAPYPEWGDRMWRFVRDIPYCLFHPPFEPFPLSRLEWVEKNLDNGEWGQAVFGVIADCQELGIPFSDDDWEVVESVARKCLYREEIKDAISGL